MEQGVSFSSDQHDTLSSFVHIPFKEDCLTAFSDANWGPQDQSVPTTPIEVPMDKLRSMSGAVFIRNGGQYPGCANAKKILPLAHAKLKLLPPPSVAKN
eukprot:15359193-Ditylum_brightwellii.AAC.1